MNNLSTRGRIGNEGEHYGTHFPKEIIRELEYYYTRTLVECIYVMWKKADVRELRNKKAEDIYKTKWQR